MKSHIFKKTISMVLALTMVLSVCSGLIQSVAASYWPEDLEIPNEYYYKGTTLQPYGSCFLIDELKNWSPDNDPDARYNRGAIPLRDRWMGPNVNPLASRDAGVMPLALGNARASQGPSQGGDGAAAYVFTFFQYLDVYNFWGGSSAEGPIAIPSPELIDAAHRNGVPVTGTIFIPWGDEAYGSQFVREMVEKDSEGHFIAADKLIEIAQYYGFDGYIFNAESGTSVAGFKDFLIYLQQHKPDNFTISWYNGSTNIGESSIHDWMQDGDTRVSDHWWLDMGGGWSGPSSSVEAARACGVDPWKIHSTWENWPMESGAKGGDYRTRLDKDGKVISSLGILAPTASLMKSKTPEDFMNVQDPKLWVGPSGDPSSDRPASGFCGFASMIADRTAVLGTDFVTNFTTGNGHNFYENGEIVGKTGGWYNRSIGDILPTWRWMIDSEGQKVSAIIDYEDAWYAGTSLKLSGNMDAGKSNHVKLYSTNLQITDASNFDFVYKTPVKGVNVELGLCFGDTYDDQNFKFYPLTTNADGNWNTTSISLAEDAGKTAIAMTLRLTAPDGVTDYSLNVGQMAITTNKNVPGAPSNAVLDEALFHTDTCMEARIYWDKADDAFMNRIYRVHTDGTRELVGVTPSDAYYLGKYNKEEGETACTFEIVSYSENGVKGGSTTIDIAWPEEVPDGFVPEFDQGENLALKKPAVSMVDALGATGVHQINDGTVLNGSKWCAGPTSGAAVIDLGKDVEISRWVTYHANCEGAGEGTDFNTVAFNLEYAADDGKPLMNGDTQESRDRANSLSWSVADRVSGNKKDVTDRNLANPITARYIKLNVLISDNCPWHAIRVYELELYTKPGVNNTASPTDRNVTVRNNSGATDEVIIENVAMPLSSGSVGAGNGVVAEKTGVVRLFNDLTSETPIATVKATQPNQLYKQLAVGVAKFENLELKPEGGRLYYDVLRDSGDEVTHSRRSSVAYAPETGTAPTDPESVTLARTTSGSQLRDHYARFTATGLEEGAVVWIYRNAADKVAVCRSMPAINGTVSVDKVPLNKDGGSVFYEIHVDGKPVSEMKEITYTSALELPADLEGIQEMITKYSAIKQSDCTSATWGAFSTALENAKSVAVEGATATAVEAARAELLNAHANLRFIGDTQRLQELCDTYGAYKAEDYLASGYQALQAAVAESRALIEGNDCDNFQIEQSRIALENAARALKPYIPTEVTGITITPAAGKVRQGKTLQFTATVAGTGDYSQEVTWKLEGNTSAGTTLENGLLTVAEDESPKTLTVTATSVTNSKISQSAEVVVIDKNTPVHTYLSKDATILGDSGKPTNSRELPEYAFDDDEATKWCSTVTPNYVAFDVHVPAKADRVQIVHAGKREGAVYNTVDFTFEVLDQTKHTDDEVLAMTAEEQKAIFDDSSNWVVLTTHKDNKEDVTDEALNTEIVSRIYRMNITKGAGENSWGDATRIFEIRLYGYETEYPQPAEQVKVTVSPTELTVVGTPGQKGQFTATVTGAEDTTVTWTISGNTSDETRIDNGQLFLGNGETAKTLIVKATSNADPTKFATATVTVEAPKYSVRISKDMVNGTVTADKTEAAAGDTITLTVTPDEGYRLLEGTLKFNSTEIKGNTFVMPAGEVLISAQFEQIPAAKYSVTVSDALTNGHITADKVEAAAGETVTLVVSPDEGYQLKAGSLKFNETAIEGDSFVMPAENVVVSAEFEKSAAKLLAEAKEAALKEVEQENLDNMTPVQLKMAQLYIDQTKRMINSAETVERVSQVMTEYRGFMESIHGWKDATKRYIDVKNGKWYTNSVDFVSNVGYMVGVSDNEFGVYQPMTRAQLISVLYRLAGSPEVGDKTHPFKDVPAGSYFEKAVIWGYNEKIVSGTTATTFEPYKNVTRAQMVAFLYRFFEKPEVTEDYLSDFEDAAQVAPYARNAMNWAVSNELIFGVVHGDRVLIDPNANLTRAQGAAVIYRLVMQLLESFQ